MRVHPLGVVAFVIAAIASRASDGKPETYRLIHAIGNSEREVARGLSKTECTIRKRELIAVGEALGTHSEARGIGSITCLPESTFQH